jgi:hypothetical protein
MFATVLSLGVSAMLPPPQIPEPSCPSHNGTMPCTVTIALGWEDCHRNWLSLDRPGKAGAPAAWPTRDDLLHTQDYDDAIHGSAYQQCFDAISASVLMSQTWRLDAPLFHRGSIGGPGPPSFQLRSGTACRDPVRGPSFLHLGLTLPFVV